MTDVLHRRSLRQAAAPEAIEAVHEELETLWDEASFVPDMDRMTFATAVIEAASNVVQHAIPASAEPVELGVEICVEQMQPGSPRQRPRRGPARPPGRRYEHARRRRGIRPGPCADPGPRDDGDLQPSGRDQHLDPLKVSFLQLRRFPGNSCGFPASTRRRSRFSCRRMVEEIPPRSRATAHDDSG